MATIVALPPKCYNITARICGASGPPSGCTDVAAKPDESQFEQFSGGGRGACLQGTFLCQGLSFLYLLVGHKGTTTAMGTSQNPSRPTRGGGAAAIFGTSTSFPAAIAASPPFPLLVAGGGGGYSPIGASGDASWTGSSGAGYVCTSGTPSCLSTGGGGASAFTGGSGAPSSCSGAGPLRISSTGSYNTWPYNNGVSTIPDSTGGGGGSGYFGGGCGSGGGGAGSSFVNTTLVYDVSGSSGTRCGDGTVSLGVSFTFPETLSPVLPAGNCSMRMFPASEVVGDVFASLEVSSEALCQQECCVRPACMGFSYFKPSLPFSRCSLLSGNITYVVPSNLFAAAVRVEVLGY